MKSDFFKSQNLVRNFSIGFVFVFFNSTCAFAGTYFIDYAAGSDNNSGTSTATAWKKHPGMPGWSGGSKYSHQAGDRFIFKGGVTWPAVSLPLTISNSGAAGNEDYYGVDTTWFIGASFSRPIFDAQGTTGSGLVSVINASHVSIDNIEMRDIAFSDNQGVGLVTIDEKSKNISVNRCFLHKWTLTNSLTTDDAHGGVIVNTGNVPPVGIIVDSTTISNSEYSATRNNGVAIRNVQTLSRSVIHDVPTAILFAGDVHGNSIYNINYPNPDFDPAYHTNLMYIAAQSFNPPIEYVYNNVIHDVGSGTGVYLEPCFYTSFGPATVSVYNNVVYNTFVGGGGIILVDPESGVGSCGKVNIYQNTLQMADTAQFGMIRAIKNHSGTNQIATLNTKNNLYIGPNGEWDLNLAASNSSLGHVQLTNPQAASKGYSANNLFAPSAATAPTVDVGVSVTCANCPSFAQDIVGVARGTGKAWDVGAYEFSNGSPLPPKISAPKNLRILH